MSNDQLVRKSDADEALTQLIELTKGLQPEALGAIIDLAIEREGSKEFKENVDEVGRTKTPEGVVGQREGPKKIILDYVRLRYMLEVLRKVCDRYEFECIQPPYIPTAYDMTGRQLSFPFFVTVWILKLYKHGKVMAAVPCTGTCDILTAKEDEAKKDSRREWIGIETAYKGCVTDAMKKGISIATNAAHDVYQYGEPGEVTTDMITQFYKLLEQEFSPAVIQPDTEEIVTWLQECQTPSSLVRRYNALREKYKKAEVSESE